MNHKLLLLSATLLGGVLSTSAVAATADVHADVLRGLKLSPPVVERLVAPTNLSRRHLNAEVLLSFTVDAAGKPTHITFVRGGDRNLRENLLPAVAQWHFTPAMKDGVAVPLKVILPIKLVEGTDS